MEEKILDTEKTNLNSLHIDAKSTVEILHIINAEDRKVPEAVGTAIHEISVVVDDVVASFQEGGRLFYIGAGTSGRLGVLDASECPPTYGVPTELVQGIIAGGNEALTRSIENAEDDGIASVEELKRRGFSSIDVLIGITASGGARYVVQALNYARNLGARVAAISCNPHSAVFNEVEKERRIYVPVGPEIIAGSTRMKSGTAQKLVLNMITTSAMILTGKVYKNLMVNVQPVNEKLVRRAIHMISDILCCPLEDAEKLFEASERDVRVAVLMRRMNCDRISAISLLQKSGGSLSRALGES